MAREPEPGSTEAAEWEAFVNEAFCDMSMTWEDTLREVAALSPLAELERALASLGDFRTMPDPA